MHNSKDGNWHAQYANVADNFTAKIVQRMLGIWKSSSSKKTRKIRQSIDWEQNYPYQIDSGPISCEKKTRKTAKNIQITAWKDFKRGHAPSNPPRYEMSIKQRHEISWENDQMLKKVSIDKIQYFDARLIFKFALHFSLDILNHF